MASADIGSKLGFYEIDPLGSHIFLPSGVTLLNSLINWFKNMYKQENFTEILIQGQINYAFAYSKLVPTPTPPTLRLINFNSLQSQAIIFCSQQMLTKEINKIFDLLDHILQNFFLEYELILSMGPPANHGWAKILMNCLDTPKIKEGEITKFDIIVRTKINSLHNLGSITLDPPDQISPVTLITEISFPKFLSVILEQTQGNLPIWLNPRKVCVLPIDPSDQIYARKIANTISSVLDYPIHIMSNGALGKRILKCTTQKYNDVIIIGNREQLERKITIRRNNEDFYKTPNEYITSLKGELGFPSLNVNNL